jgi:hypothetical protein
MLGTPSADLKGRTSCLCERLPIRLRYADGVTFIRLPRIVLALIVGLAAGCGPSEAERAAAETEARAKAEEAKARDRAASARREAERLAALWTYSDTPAGKGRQLSTYIFSTEMIDTDGKTPNRVQFVFRDHAEWGRSSYLVLQGGDFDCYSGCRVQVKVDDGPAKPMAARRPKTDEAIAMFINDEAALWKLTAGARRLSIEFPVRAGGTRTAAFEVSGLDRTKMPGWDG